MAHVCKYHDHETIRDDIKWAKTLEDGLKYFKLFKRDCGWCQEMREIALEYLKQLKDRLREEGLKG